MWKACCYISLWVLKCNDFLRFSGGFVSFFLCQVGLPCSPFCDREAQPSRVGCVEPLESTRVGGPAKITKRIQKKPEVSTNHLRLEIWDPLAKGAEGGRKPTRFLHLHRETALCHWALRQTEGSHKRRACLSRGFSDIHIYKQECMNKKKSILISFRSRGISACSTVRFICSAAFGLLRIASCPFCTALVSTWRQPGCPRINKCRWFLAPQLKNRLYSEPTSEPLNVATLKVLCLESPIVQWDISCKKGLGVGQDKHHDRVLHFSIFKKVWMGVENIIAHIDSRNKSFRNLHTEVEHFDSVTWAKVMKGNECANPKGWIKDMETLQPTTRSQGNELKQLI